MKKSIIITLIGLIFTSFSASADPTCNLKLNSNINARPGKTMDVDLILENSVSATDLYVEMFLPVGITPVVASQSGANIVYAISMNQDRAGSHSAIGKYREDKNRYRILIDPSGLNEASFSGNNGTIATLHFDVSSKFKGGKIQLTDNSYVQYGANYDIEYFSSSEYQVGINNTYAGYDAKINDVTIKAGETATVDLALINPLAVNGFYAKLFLPKGIKAVNCVANADRMDGHNFTWQTEGEEGGWVSILIDSQNGGVNAIKGTSGTIASITLQADATIESGSAIIKMKGAYVTDMSNNDFYLESKNFTIKTRGSADYTFFINDIVLKAGQEQKLVLSLDNNEDIIGVMAKLNMPDGITVTKAELGDRMLAEDGKSYTHVLTCNEDENPVKFIIDAKDPGGKINGNSGAICIFTIKAAETLTSGTYNISMTNITLSSDGSDDIYLPSKKFSVKAVGKEAYQLKANDVNVRAGKSAQMEIELTNQVAVNGFFAKFVIPEGLNVIGVELNKDRIKDHILEWGVQDNVLLMMADSQGSIGIQDFVGNSGVIATVTLKADADIETGSKQIKMIDAYVDDSDFDDIYVDNQIVNVTVMEKPNYSVEITDFSIAPKSSNKMDVELKNEDPVNGFYAEFIIPEGLNVVMDGDEPKIELNESRATDHDITCSVEGNRVKVLIDSKTNRTPFVGESGTLFSITLEAPGEIPSTSNIIKMKNAYVCDSENEEPQIADRAFNIEIATDINEVESVSAENAVIYNISGQRVNSAAHGIFIMNGKKTVVK